MKRSSYKDKALERLETAKWSLSKGYFSSCASNLYFAFFNYFQHVVGDPPKGKWEHIGIAKAFVHIAYKNLSFPVEKLRRLKEAYDDLYGYRISADYTSEKISPALSSIFEEYINLLAGVMNGKG